MKSFNYFFVSCAIIATCFGKEDGNSQLRGVFVMFRHGERTPDPEQMQTFPKYEYKDSKFEPYGIGQLTTVGKETMYDLGKKIKDHYAKRLYGEEKLDLSQVKMESTGYFRSLLSAEFVLGGLLDWNKNDMLNKEWKVDNEDINKLKNSKKEKMLKFYYQQKKECPTYFHTLLGSVQNKMKEGKLKACMPYFGLMASKLGVEKPDPLKVWEMYEVFKAQQNADLTLPDWLKPEELIKMEKCIEEFLGIAFETDLLKKLSGGIYTDLVIQSIKKVLNGKTDVLLELFSGHDTTIAPAVAALGGPKGYTKNGADFLVDIPTYGSAIIVELYKDKKANKHFVKIQYLNGKDQKEPTELKMKGCSTPCYLSEYNTVIEPVRINWKTLSKCPKE